MRRMLHVAIVLVGALAHARPSYALQPLDSFVSEARKANNRNREARAIHKERGAESEEALGRALPSLVFRGALARTQLTPSFPGSNGQPQQPLVPQNIWLLDAGVTIPIDVGAWERFSASRATSRSAEAAMRETALGVEREVTRDYYDLVGAEAILRSAQHELRLSNANADVVRAQHREGESSMLDLERTRADVARAQQDVADAEGNVVLARRRLESASGVTPEAATTFPIDDLHDEAPLT
ncbi:MAG TPA: TolC family protein, partial [Polyangiaceae bacterium]